MDYFTAQNIKIPPSLDGKYFKIVSHEQNGVDYAVKVLCVTCQDVKKENKILSGSFKFTTNFRLHIKRVHFEKLTLYDEHIKQNSTRNPDRKRPLDQSSTEDLCPLKQSKISFFNKQDKQKELDTNIMRYIVLGMKPLSTVEDENFIKIIKGIDNNFKVYSRRTLNRRINDDFIKVVENIKNVFTTEPRALITTTADIWSTKHRSFMGVTAHWITANTLERGNCVLACKRINGKHSYDVIAELLQDIFNEFSLLREQIVSTVTDNGSNFIKAFKEFGYDIQDHNMNDDMDFDDEEAEETLHFQIIAMDGDDGSNEQAIFLPHHLRCASHTLSLIATTDFSTAIKNSSVNRLHNGAIGKCTTLWNMSRRPKSSEIIHNLLGSSLFYPCPTRWNSLYDALSQLLKFKDKLNALFQHLNVNSSFKDIELAYLDELIILLKPIACSLDCLQAQNNCFYGVLIPTLFSLKSRLENLKEKNFKYCAFFITPLISSVTKRFNLFFELSPEINEAILATCFHPNFKLRWIPHYISDKKKKDNTEFVYKCYRKTN